MHRQPANGNQIKPETVPKRGTKNSCQARKCLKVVGVSLQAFHRAQLETALVPLKRKSCFFLYIWLMPKGRVELKLGACHVIDGYRLLYMKCLANDRHPICSNGLYILCNVVSAGGCLHTVHSATSHSFQLAEKQWRRQNWPTKGCFAKIHPPNMSPIRLLGSGGIVH